MKSFILIPFLKFGVVQLLKIFFEMLKLINSCNNIKEINQSHPYICNVDFIIFLKFILQKVSLVHKPVNLLEFITFVFSWNRFDNTAIVQWSVHVLSMNTWRWLPYGQFCLAAATAQTRPSKVYLWQVWEFPSGGEPIVLRQLLLWWLNSPWTPGHIGGVLVMLVVVVVLLFSVLVQGLVR